MKSVKYILPAFLAIVLTVFTVRTSRADVYDDVAAAIKAGNTRELAKFFSERVELKLGDKEGVYSKAQAEVMLREFFDKNSPINFSIKHKGSSQKGLSYVIGYLQSSNGSYRTMIRFKQSGNQMLIQELRFERE